MLPIVAIVGRPNVGKSTLFNRLMEQRLAIVHDEPGVTRDRHYATAAAFRHALRARRHGRVRPRQRRPDEGRHRQGVRAAIAEADVIVFVGDASAPVTGADRAAVDLLRRSDKPVIYVANKADSSAATPRRFKLYRLGVPEVLPVSSLHGRGIGDLETAIVARLPRRGRERKKRREPDDERSPHRHCRAPERGQVVIINKVLGESRMLVDDRPGTTRDSIDTLVTREGKRYMLVDTAGIRKSPRSRRPRTRLEELAVLSAIRAIERAEVVVVMCDANEGVSEQDAKILGLANDRLRAMVIGLNKTDLLDKKGVAKAIEHAKDKLVRALGADLCHVGEGGARVGELFRTVDAVRAAYSSGRKLASSMASSLRCSTPSPRRRWDRAPLASTSSPRWPSRLRPSSRCRTRRIPFTFSSATFRTNSASASDSRAAPSSCTTAKARTQPSPKRE